ncbi:MAG TPA: hypothetical protein VNQ90_20035 [Chthoniobacteraceae bacterium]|nr:hypothetical protein [Chthoniobacteraceae bacterium]
MSDSPLDLDLKLLPDWLKEPEGKNRYADHPGEGRSSRHDRRPGEHRSRPSAPRRSGPPSRGNRGERTRGPSAGEPRNDRRTGGKREPRHRGGAPAATGERPARPEREETIAVPLEIAFIPNADAIAALIQQIKTGNRAYPLYGLGRMFLNKPERHRVRITTLAPACPLFKIGEDGPVTLNRQHAQREAFRRHRDTYYTRETTEVEPPKGNFSNVARCRISGTLLGPTNHHGYQPALRRLYDGRFSRRSDFNTFLRQIEVVSDPEVIEAWKKESSSVTLYRTTREAEPVEFKTVQEVEAHFMAHYLDQVLESAKSVEVSGVASRQVEDRTLRDAIRDAWEKERGFPSQIVNQVRPSFMEAGLAIWKHRKRLLYVSLVRPSRFSAKNQQVSPEITSLLTVIESKPKATRADLSEALLKPFQEEEGFEKRKSTLASDLKWLTQAGHVIEFHDGTFDLPLPPREPSKEAGAPAPESVPGEDAPATAPAVTVSTSGEPAEQPANEGEPAAEDAPARQETASEPENPPQPAPASESDGSETAPTVIATPPPATGEAEAAPDDEAIAPNEEKATQDQALAETAPVDVPGETVTLERADEQAPRATIASETEKIPDEEGSSN